MVNELVVDRQIAKGKEVTVLASNGTCLVANTALSSAQKNKEKAA